jgi:hypothetical protein
MPRVVKQPASQAAKADSRMATRIDHGRVQLLTRTGLDWTALPRKSFLL